MVGLAVPVSDLCDDDGRLYLCDRHPSIDVGAAAATFLTAALVINLGTLALFKYLDFFIQSSSAAISHLGGTPNLALLNLVLPLGISFYTFHALSYAIDVYRRRSEPERNYFIYLSFVMFFPLAGCRSD